MIIIIIIILATNQPTINHGSMMNHNEHKMVHRSMTQTQNKTSTIQIKIQTKQIDTNTNI